MRSVVLNGVHYDILGDITKHRINPWTAKISSGSREYDHFQNVSMEEWHDFRGGIGLESALPDETARTWWCENVDVTSARSAVIGPLVTQAGSYGKVAKFILDFRGATYAIGQGYMAYWNTATSAWVATGSPTETLIEDCEDAWNEITVSGVTSSTSTDKQVGTYSAYLVVARGAIAGATILATEAISSLDLSGSVNVRFWIKASGAGKSTGDLQLLLDNTAACASPLETLNIPALVQGEWTLVTLALADPSLLTAVISIGIKTTTSMWVTGATIRIDDVQGVTLGGLGDPRGAIVVTDDTDEYLVVADSSQAIYTPDGITYTALVGPKGPMALYDDKLYSIDPDGRTIRASPVNDIDGTWTSFNWVEDTGTIHRFFVGKLLADDTPVLYFTGTKGLWSVDTVNSKVYKQEITYPPLDDAGRGGMYFNANIYVATGGGIIKLAPSSAVPIGPDLDDGLPDGYQGAIYDMIGVGNWIVYCVNGGASNYSSIFKRHTSYGGNLQVYTRATVNEPIRCLHHSPSSMYTDGRLWIGMDTNVYYIPFPDTTSNPKQVPTYTYRSASAEEGLILPIFRKLAAVKKVALGVALVTKSCNANEYITIDHKINNAATWTELGTYKTSPRPTIVEFNSGLGTEFYVIQFAAKLQRGTTTTNSPELESIMFYWYPVTTKISAWTFQIDCTDDHGQKRLDDLETLEDTTTLIVFNPTGDEKKTDYNYNVKVIVSPENIQVDEMGGRKGIAQIRCEQIFEG